MLENLLKDYLNTIKNIQEIGMIQTPYALEEQRQKLHHQILEELNTCYGLGNISDIYIRSKTIFENLDVINGLYSECEEWKLKTDRDVVMMARDLDKYLTSGECRMYLSGDVDNPVHIKYINKREAK